MRSLPISVGLSMRMFRPVRMPGPTTRQLFPVSLRIAVRNELSTGGTTDATIVPSIMDGTTSNSAKMFLSSAQY